MDGLRSLLPRLREKWMLLVSTLLVGMLVASHLWREHPRPDFEKVMDAVVVIQTPSGSGSGFFVTSDGCAITAAHVVMDALAKKQRIVVVTRGVAKRLPGTVVGLNQYFDVAMICTPIDSPAWIRVVDTEELEPGDPVWAIGHPTGGRTWNISDGVVSRMGYKMHQIAPGVWFPRFDIWTSAFISWGNSGGPIVDRWGNAVGMIVEWDGREIGRPNNSNVAVPGTDLRRFIRTLWGKY